MKPATIKRAVTIVGTFAGFIWAINCGRIAWAVHQQSIQTQIADAREQGADHERARINRVLRDLENNRQWGRCLAKSLENRT